MIFSGWVNKHQQKVKVTRGSGLPDPLDSFRPEMDL
jgi:hypothetical protein